MGLKSEILGGRHVGNEVPRGFCGGEGQLSLHLFIFSVRALLFSGSKQVQSLALA